MLHLSWQSRPTCLMVNSFLAAGVRGASPRRSVLQHTGYATDTFVEHARCRILSVCPRPAIGRRSPRSRPGEARRWKFQNAATGAPCFVINRDIFIFIATTRLGIHDVRTRARRPHKASSRLIVVFLSHSVYISALDTKKRRALFFIAPYNKMPLFTQTGLPCLSPRQKKCHVLL